MSLKNALYGMSGELPGFGLGGKALSDTTLEVTPASSMSYFP